MPHELNLNLRVATTMSQYYSLMRKLRPTNGIDLNSVHPNEYNVCASSSHSSSLNNFVLPSPWELGYLWCPYDLDVTSLNDHIGSLIHEDRFVVAHYIPKALEVSGSSLNAQLRGNCYFEQDLFDVLIRILRNEDDQLYSSFGQFRWCHIFESDLMDTIISGSYEVVNDIIRQNLSVHICPYDLSKCKLLFFPALLHRQWVCFVWSLDSNVIHVFEPSYSVPLPESRMVAIERACYLLKIAMQTLSRSVLEGWSHQCMSADVRLLTLSDSCLSRHISINRSGAICSCFCRSFDGNVIIPRASELIVDGVVAHLFSDVVKWKNNAVRFPIQISL